MSSTQTPRAPHAADHEAARSSVTPARSAAAADVTVTDTTYTSSNTSITIARTSTGSGSDALASDILYIARGPGCARVHRIRAAAQPPGQ